MVFLVPFRTSLNANEGKSFIPKSIQLNDLIRVKISFDGFCTMGEKDFLITIRNLFFSLNYMSGYGYENLIKENKWAL